MLHIQTLALILSLVPAGSRTEALLTKTHAPEVSSAFQASHLALLSAAKPLDDKLLEEQVEVASKATSTLHELSGAHAEFLGKSEVKMVLHWFGKTRLAARDLMVEDGPDREQVQAFHTHLGEFIRALTGKADSHGKTPSCSGKCKKLLKAMTKLGDQFNRTPGMQAVETINLDRSTPAVDAVWYGQRMVDRVEFIIENRGAKQITGEGRRATNETTDPAFTLLRGALEAMIDSRGERVIQLDEDGSPMSNQLEQVEDAIADLSEALDLLIQVHPWSKRRVELVRGDLVLIEKNLAKSGDMKRTPKPEEAK
jgi:hypothetical protein